MFIYPHGTHHLRIVATSTSHPHSLRTPVLQPATTDKDELSPSSVMSRLSLILEALVGTVSHLSATPKLLDRVFAHLCTSKWPFPSLDICIVLTKCP